MSQNIMYTCHYSKLVLIDPRPNLVTCHINKHANCVIISHICFLSIF